MQTAVVSPANPNAFATLDAWLAAILRQAQPGQLARINRRVAYELRRSQSQRIAGQKNPDGSAFAPRKAKPPKNLRGKRGKLKVGAMFRRIRTARFLKVSANPAQLTVGYKGRAGRIAVEHQTGLRGRENLPARALLGLSRADVQLLADAYLRHLADAEQTA